MCHFLSFSVVEIGFILSQRHCRFLFISVIAGLLILLQRQITTLWKLGFKQHWNTHYIRKSGFETVEGRPDELYYLPECAGATDHLWPVSDTQFDKVSQYCHEYEENSIIQQYFQNVKEQMGLPLATSRRQARKMYHNLCEIALD